jgi:hypothetical protein
MAPKPLDLLKKRLAKFSNRIKDRKDKLTTKLSQNEKISPAEEQCLDNKANTVEEQCVLDALEEASDYERGVERLDENGKNIVKKLREWAGGQMAGNKQKRTKICIPQSITH